MKGRICSAILLLVAGFCFGKERLAGMLSLVHDSSDFVGYLSEERLCRLSKASIDEKRHWKSECANLRKSSHSSCDEGFRAYLYRMGENAFVLGDLVSRKH